ncbi:hypothetical protein KCH_26460 [Kitasatospora cheerisanensis KCTC 2395]|uniref:Uncharacterized protein n=1 Tax=Kitasatospora cheerisanensis KCTC 2395 TaxID=1348663 RepID=A0A066Z063_9ACTN|nr:hypothetical protein KCH_26460 [Kitasatospora cheerisanensis KCTC 2395]
MTRPVRGEVRGTVTRFRSAARPRISGGGRSKIYQGPRHTGNRLGGGPPARVSGTPEHRRPGANCCTGRRFPAARPRPSPTR